MGRVIPNLDLFSLAKTVQVFLISYQSIISHLTIHCLLDLWRSICRRYDGPGTAFGSCFVQRERGRNRAVFVRKVGKLSFMRSYGGQMCACGLPSHRVVTRVTVFGL